MKLAEALAGGFALKRGGLNFGKRSANLKSDQKATRQHLCVLIYTLFLCMDITYIHFTMYPLVHKSIGG
jgi:hypothetical protein